MTPAGQPCLKIKKEFRRVMLWIYSRASCLVSCMSEMCARRYTHADALEGGKQPSFSVETLHEPEEDHNEARHRLLWWLCVIFSLLLFLRLLLF